MNAREENRAALPMPVKAAPYRHQKEAFGFACGLFGLQPGGGGAPHSIKSSPGCALLMEMPAG